MGVRGLTAFLDRNPGAWDKLALKPPTPEEIKAGKGRVIKLAVDGYALLFHLYFSGNFNCVCGGQYAQFAEHVRAYVSTLQKCGFSMFVVMDGTVNPAKEATIISRENDQIKTVRQLTYSDKYMGKKVLPLMAKQAFLDVMQELKVKVSCADSEADVIVGALARANGCCAMSKDSDFFIFDLPFGYIPIDCMDVDRRTGVVTAKRFARGKFCAEMKLKEEFLPLLASAVGNDYVSSSLIRPFHVSLGEVDVKLPAGWQSIDGKEPSIRDLLILRVCAFIAKEESTEKAIAAIVAAAKKQNEEDVAAGVVEPMKEGEEEREEFTAEALEAALRTSVAQYALNPKHASALGATTELTTAAPVGMDPKLIGLFRDCKIDRLLMNVLTAKTFWCNIHMEDVDGDCTWLIGRPLRQLAYAALLEGSSSTVTEYIRQGQKLVSEEVAVEGSVPGISQALSGKATAEARAKALWGALGEPAKDVPEHLKLASACVRYWIRSTGSTTTAVELATVVACMLQKKEEQVMRVSKEARPSWLSMKTTHKLASLHIVFYSANMLNQALLNPVEPFKIADVYDGEFMHRFHHLQFRAKNISSLGDQLRKDNIEWQDFLKLYRAIAADVATYMRGDVVEQMDGGLMWGPTGPEGKDEDRGMESLSLKKSGQAAAATGGGFGALLGGDEESEEEEEEEEKVKVAAPPPKAPSPTPPSKEEKGKKKKGGDAEDDELAKLMAEMEAVDEKRQKQKERKKKK